MCGLIDPNTQLRDIITKHPAATIKVPKCHYCKTNNVIHLWAPFCSVGCRDGWYIHRKVELDKMWGNN